MLQRVLAKTDSNPQGEVVDLLIEQLLAEHNDHSVLGQLDTVEVVECAGVAARRAERRDLAGAERPGAAQARRRGRHHLGQARFSRRRAASRST